MIYVKNCPVCDKELKYKYKCSYDKSIKDNQMCSSCRRREVSSRPEYKEMMSKYFSEKYKGEGNPFYNKKHTQETKDKISISVQEYYIDKDNPMKGKSVYSIWLEKYGGEIADIKMEEWKNKISISTSGENSFWFGKTLPNGVGAGWSGWYKDWFFRSLLELSYMINIIERFNINWIPAENNKYRIEYIKEDGVKSTYCADFILDNKYMIEIKPKSLIKYVKVKSDAAIKFCNENNLKFKIVSPRKIELEELIKIYASGNLKFTEKTEAKYIKYINENASNNN